MSSDMNSLIEVLTQAEEQTKQLQAYLDEPIPSLLCKPLAQNLNSTIKTAITMVTEGLPMPRCPNYAGSDSPRSASDSPQSENSDRVFKDERREILKKRKTLPKWTNQVRVSSGIGLEAPLEDGYSWRKYGQKDILGATHPRGYYRCTHRNAQGCLATKQVQRSDNDPSVFDVIYRGSHTCLLRSRRGNPLQQNQHTSPTDQDQTQQPQDQQLLQSFQTTLQLKTEGLDTEAQDPVTSSFSFPSTPATCMNSSHLALDDHSMGSFSQPFGQSELAEIVSAATSAINSPTVEMDFVIDQVELNDNSFLFDTSNFKWW